MKAELTDWFDSSERPSLSGVYQTRIPHIASRASYQFWTGSWWGCYAWTPEHASLVANAGHKGNFQAVQWRGLASDPSAAA